MYLQEIAKKILLDSLLHCQQSQGLQLHARVLMTYHLNTICSCSAGKDLGDIWRNSKSFTAMKIIDAIIKNPTKSRKEHLLQCFEAEGYCPDGNLPNNTTNYSNSISPATFGSVNKGLLRSFAIATLRLSPIC
jgi:hypothetical protein